jgi:hypothetical protein
VNQRFTFIAARLAIGLFLVRGYLCRGLCAAVFTYCWVMSRVIAFLQGQLLNLMLNLGEQVRRFRGRCQSHRETLSAKRSAGADRGMRAMHQVARSRLVAERYGYQTKAVVYEAAIDMLGLSIASLDGALAISSSEILALERNIQSLDSIFSKPPSPISGLELVLWMVTNSLHVNDTLGDFREAYESKLVKRGSAEAVAWARSQVYRDVKNRLSVIAKIFGWGTAAFEWIKRNVHKH